jgi:hypothetical protein
MALLSFHETMSEEYRFFTGPARRGKVTAAVSQVELPTNFTRIPRTHLELNLRRLQDVLAR